MGLRTAGESRIYSASYESVLSEVLVVVRELKWRVRKSDESTGVIEASAGVSLLSWGENIDIQLTKSADNTRTRVAIMSSAKAQLVDWGKSSSNVNKFFSALDRRFFGKIVL